MIPPAWAPLDTEAMLTRAAHPVSGRCIICGCTEALTAPHVTCQVRLVRALDATESEVMALRHASHTAEVYELLSNEYAARLRKVRAEIDTIHANQSRYRTMLQTAVVRTIVRRVRHALDDPPEPPEPPAPPRWEPS